MLFDADTDLLMPRSRYSLFTLGMLLLFEGTVVMSRLKSMQTLRRMGNAPRPVYVFRAGTWTQVSTERLLPGGERGVSSCMRPVLTEIHLRHVCSCQAIEAGNARRQTSSP
jgi:hypothetical protein